ncbi:MAG: hypothetical protein WCI89_02110 [bacterium]
MTLQQQYAHALHDLVSTAPEHSRTYLTGLMQTLKKKGHIKLAPQILVQYQQIIETKKRSEKYTHVTEESERTRVLLELYRKLVATS